MEKPARPLEGTTFRALGIAKPNSGSSISNPRLKSCAKKQGGGTSQSLVMTLYKMDTLKSRFADVTDPSTMEIDRIAKETRLSFRGVHTWFHRKRMLQQKIQLGRNGSKEHPISHGPSPMLTKSLTKDLILSAKLQSHMTTNSPHSGLVPRKIPANISMKAGRTGPVGMSQIDQELMKTLENIGKRKREASSNESPGTELERDQGFRVFDRSKVFGQRRTSFDFSASKNPRTPLSEIAFKVPKPVLTVRPFGILNPPTKRKGILAPRAQVRREVQFHCLSCTNYLPTREAWMRHQASAHFPILSFACRLYRDTKPCGEVFFRKDDAELHMGLVHGILADVIIGRSLLRFFTYGNFHHDRCGFEACQKKLTSWEKSMDHIFEHVKHGARRQDWTHCCTNDHEQKLVARMKQLSEEAKGRTQVPLPPSIVKKGDLIIDEVFQKLVSGEFASRSPERGQDPWEGSQNSRLGSRPRSVRSGSYCSSQGVMPHLDTYCCEPRKPLPFTIDNKSLLANDKENGNPSEDPGSTVLQS